MEGLNVDEVFQHFRLNPTEVEAVTYYLPRLIAGETHGAEKLIHDAHVYDCEPKDLAARYAPVPQAVSSGDRFFFTTCKRAKGRTTRCARKAGGGTWTVNTTTVVTHAGVDVGERKNLSFKKQGKSTGWVMEEYRLLPPPEAVVADEEKVFCKIHLSQHAPDEARRESAAYKHQGRAELVPRPAPQPEHAGKRPAPGAVADPHPPRPMKRIRVDVPVPEPATPSFTAAAPVSLPAEPIPEAEDDMAWLSCTMEELLGEVQLEETLPVQARNSIEQNFYSESQEPQNLFADAEEEIVGTSNAAADLQAPFEAECQAEEALDMEMLFAMTDEAAAEQERQAVSTNDNSSIVQDKPIFLHPSETKWQADNAAADLQAPSLQGDDHLFNSRPSFSDPFEAAWRAEEALEKENAAANLQAGPLAGHNDFFWSSTVY
ncbi:uncharacterized protein [Aegilops tauschii subsp. strangulata]|uniref:uncharacterized protein n=1 Tax=Aegilops tauschii subsp. strangulata TaxID=200361 RepID=UPI000989B62C|nr:NAC domain-containing protein 46-like [Aegilops tauschii subsp. strangulata]